MLQGFDNDFSLYIRDMQEGKLPAINRLSDLVSTHKEALGAGNTIANTAKDALVSTAKAFGIYVPKSKKLWKTAKFFENCATEAEALDTLISCFGPLSSFFRTSAVKNWINPPVFKPKEPKEPKPRVFCDVEPEPEPDTAPKGTPIGAKTTKTVEGAPALPCPGCDDKSALIVALRDENKALRDEIAALTAKVEALTKKRK